jgi:molybdopterin converting factor small subunit
LVSVTVRYTAPELREITKRAEDKLELCSGSTLSNLFHILAEKYGDAFMKYVFDSNGNVRQNLFIVLNGRSLEKHRELFGMTLGQEDLLAILSPLSGG